jgi:hypothetical protein
LHSIEQNTGKKLVALIRESEEKVWITLHPKTTEDKTVIEIQKGSFVREALKVIQNVARDQMTVKQEDGGLMSSKYCNDKLNKCTKFVVQDLYQAGLFEWVVGESNHVPLELPSAYGLHKFRATTVDDFEFCYELRKIKYQSAPQSISPSQQSVQSSLSTPSKQMNSLSALTFSSAKPTEADLLRLYLLENGMAAADALEIAERFKDLIYERSEKVSSPTFHTGTSSNDKVRSWSIIHSFIQSFNHPFIH